MGPNDAATRLKKPTRLLAIPVTASRTLTVRAMNVETMRGTFGSMVLKLLEGNEGRKASRNHGSDGEKKEHDRSQSANASDGSRVVVTHGTNAASEITCNGEEGEGRLR